MNLDIKAITDEIECRQFAQSTERGRTRVAIEVLCEHLNEQPKEKHNGKKFNGTAVSCHSDKLLVNEHEESGRDSRG